MIGHPSPPWPRTIKIIAAVTFMVLAALAFWRFLEFVQLFVLAALMAFILRPTLAFLQRWLRLPRGVAVFVTYLLFALMLAVVGLVVGALVQNQLGGLMANILETGRGITAVAERFITSSPMLPFNSVAFGGKCRRSRAVRYCPNFMSRWSARSAALLDRAARW
ncbi:MAG: AI-2E family transporter [Anaerolineales bacterium]|nr:AI-2E family transporter [Anaerolineales bacterium]